MKGAAQNAEKERKIRHGTNPCQQNAQFQKWIRSNSLDLMDFNVRLSFRFESYPSVPMMSYKKKN